MKRKRDDTADDLEVARPAKVQVREDKKGDEGGGKGAHAPPEGKGSFAPLPLTPLYVAIDVECVGDALDAPLPAIGFWYGTSADDGKGERFVWPMPDRSAFGKRCWDEFWSKETTLFEKLSQLGEAVRGKESDEWKRLGAFIDSLGASGREVIFLGDNLGYDVPRIDFVLWKHLGRHPMRYTADGQYCDMADVSDRYKHLAPLVKEKIKAILNRTAPKTHYPDEDAKRVYLWYWLGLKAVAAGV